MNKNFFLLAFVVFLTQALSAQSFDVLDSVITSSVNNKDIPGAVLCIVKDTQIVYLHAYGNKEIYPKKKPMTTSTIFDLASLSKPVGAGMASVLLIQQNKLSLTDKVADYIPGFNPKVLVEHLLTHTSGLPAYANVNKLKSLYGSPARDSLISYIALLSNNASLPFDCQIPDNCDLKEAAAFRYSCLNFITLQRVVEVVSGQTLKDFCAENIFGPLKMTHTAYCPPASWQKNIAPTEYLKDERRLLCGEVHDPLARVMNAGISGNAGVFSTAEDLAKLAKFFLNINDSAQASLLSVDDISMFRSMPQERLEGRALGWDVCSDYAWCKGSFLSPEAFCHTGYTGTEMVIDPVRRIAIILLTNRAHPYDKGSVGNLRRQVADNVALIYPLLLPAPLNQLNIAPLPNSITNIE